MEEKLLLLGAKVNKSPHNLFFRYSYAQALLEADMCKQAIEELKICTVKKPEWMMAFLLLAQAQLSSGQKEDARSSLLTTMELAKEQGHDDPFNEASSLLGSIQET